MEQGLPTKPYLIRAIYEWCVDSGFTPYLAVAVDRHARVPLEHVKNGEIVLNIGAGATRNLRLGNDMIEFSARFNGASRQIEAPIGNVLGIYARENGQGLAFPREIPEGEDAMPTEPPVPPRGKPQLKLVK
ncbi:MAG: ClpXP protease specificity-enhancing factor [Sulfuricellaceae bacterium]